MKRMVITGMLISLKTQYEKNGNNWNADFTKNAI
jgi:hypothetical protein